MNDTDNRVLILSGLIGLFAALLVGSGEFLLHFDPSAQYGAESAYAFMLDIPGERMTLGHFLAVSGLPLYLVGCYHIYLMLKPANRALALIALVVAVYGFVVGGVWIGSRASIGALIQITPASTETQELIDLYQLRYETLLTVIRITTLILSLIIFGLTLTGRSRYPRFLAFFNPAVLIVCSFLLFQLIPQIGKYLMPIALNVAFFVCFFVSTWSAWRHNRLP